MSYLLAIGFGFVLGALAGGRVVVEVVARRSARDSLLSTRARGRGLVAPVMGGAIGIVLVISTAANAFAGR